MIPLEAILLSMDHATSKGHVGVSSPAAARGCVGVCGSYYHRRPCGLSVSVLPPEAMPVSSVAARDHVNVHGA